MPQVPIAIVGVSALFAGSHRRPGLLARHPRGASDLITDVPPTHWLVEDYYDPGSLRARQDLLQARRASSPTVPFDPMEFGVPPNIVPATDTSAAARPDRGAARCSTTPTQGQFAKMDRERASVILGVTSGQELLGSMVSRLQRPVWIKALRERGHARGRGHRPSAIACRAQYVPWQEATFPGLLGNVVAGRIANRLDLRGTELRDRRRLRQRALGGLRWACQRARQLGEAGPGDRRRRRHA